jgi:type I restriction enzyme R subunit
MDNLPSIDSDDLVAYALNVIKPRLLELDVLLAQATYPSCDMFANSPDLGGAILNLILDSLPNHTELSQQLLGSEQMRESLKEFLLGPAQLLESLRLKSQHI